ncbi:hypothetical protein Emag_002967 [Eimeria magna]
MAPPQLWLYLAFAALVFPQRIWPAEGHRLKCASQALEPKSPFSALTSNRSRKVFKEQQQLTTDQDAEFLETNDDIVTEATRSYPDFTNNYEAESLSFKAAGRAELENSNQEEANTHQELSLTNYNSDLDEHTEGGRPNAGGKEGESKQMETLMSVSEPPSAIQKRGAKKETMTSQHDDEVYSQAVDTIPGIGFLGSGYDLVIGNPLGDEHTPGDPGFKAPVILFDWGHDKEGVSPDLTTLQPKGGYVRPFVSCRQAETVEEVESLSAYVADLAADASSDGNLPYLPFSGSFNFRQMVDESLRKQTKTFILRAYCLRYEAGFAAVGMNSSRTTEAFRKAVESLPAAFPSTSEGSVCTPEAFKQQSQAEAEGGSKKDNTSNSFGAATTTFAVGGRAPRDPSDPQELAEWAKSVAVLPMPVKYELQPLSRLLPENLLSAYQKAQYFYSRVFGLSPEDLELSADNTKALPHLLQNSTAVTEGKEVFFGMQMSFFFNKAGLANVTVAHCSPGRLECRFQEGGPAFGQTNSQHLLIAACVPRGLQKLFVASSAGTVSSSQAVDASKTALTDCGLNAAHVTGFAMEVHTLMPLVRGAMNACPEGKRYCALENFVVPQSADSVRRRNVQSREPRYSSLGFAICALKDFSIADDEPISSPRGLSAKSEALYTASDNNLAGADETNEGPGAQRSINKHPSL